MKVPAIVTERQPYRLLSDVLSGAEKYRTAAARELTHAVKRKCKKHNRVFFISPPNIAVIVLIGGNKKSGTDKTFL